MRPLRTWRVPAIPMAATGMAVLLPSSCPAVMPIFWDITLRASSAQAHVRAWSFATGRQRSGQWATAPWPSEHFVNQWAVPWHPGASPRVEGEIRWVVIKVLFREILGRLYRGWGIPISTPIKIFTSIVNIGTTGQITLIIVICLGIWPGYLSSEEIILAIYITAVNERNGGAAAMSSPGSWTCAWLLWLRSVLLNPVLRGLLFFLHSWHHCSVHLSAFFGALLQGRALVLSIVFRWSFQFLSLPAALHCCSIIVISIGKARALER